MFNITHVMTVISIGEINRNNAKIIGVSPYDDFYCIFSQESRIKYQVNVVRNKLDNSTGTIQFSYNKITSR